jgi:aminopeptidase
LAVYEEVVKSGGDPHLQVDLPGTQEAFYRLATDDQINHLSRLDEFVVDNVDVSIGIRSDSNTREMSGADPAKQSQRRKALMPLFKTSMQRAATGEFRWVGTLYPTNAYAQDAEMSLREYEEFVYGACFCDQDDPVARWQEVHDMQQKLVDWLEGKREVRVTGPNADLSLSIEDRVFMNSDGHKNMPSGEIFTGPVEDSAEGWVKFTYPAVTAGREVEGIELKFEKGKVVEASAKKGEEFLLKMLDTDPGARYVGEFAIGTNDGIKRFTKNILFDEKIGGSFHMAVGFGFPETGSKNESAIHWDMICDMRDGGEIHVDGELFYRSGEFVI